MSGEIEWFPMMDYARKAEQTSIQVTAKMDIEIPGLRMKSLSLENSI